MKGTVILFDEVNHTGKISGHDGNRYNFARTDWTGSKAPKNGIEIDFVAEGENAKDIIVLNKSSNGDKDKTTVGLLALFLGGIGVHHFYLGNSKKGIKYLLFFWTLIPAIISFFEGIKILTSDQVAFDEKYN